MIPILGPIVAALGGALGLGAAGGAATTGIGALLGNAWLPALGTGIGTLLTGGSGRDALRNAALAGGGSMLFPGVGKSVTGGISQLFGLGGNQASGSTSTVTQSAPQRRPAQPEPAAPAIPAAPGMSPMGQDIQERRRSPMGQDIQERRRSTLPGIAALSDMGADVAGRRTPYASPIPLDPRLNFLPEIPQMESSQYQSPYAAMAREEMDRLNTAGEDLLRYSPDAVRTPAEIDFDLGNRNLDLAYQGYNERPDVMSGDVDPSIAKELPYIDPYTMTRYATKEERDAAMEKTMALKYKGAPLKSYVARDYAMGGEIEGPGTGTSDSIPATIYQRGKPVEDASLSDGEFVMTAKAVRGMGNGSRERGVTRMYELMRRFENGEMA